jgi:L-lactate dehydrogenase complex protein LldF
MPEPFAQRYDAAVHDDQLGANLLAFQRGWREGRDQAFTLTPAPEPFEALRARLVAAKTAVIDDQAAYLDEFVLNAEGQGATVHRAATAGQAIECVLAICRAAGADLVVKTKSMLSEELNLNHELEAKGIRAVETDVGEWIVQLRHETPSHMVMPAIHLNRRQVSQTLSDEVHHPVSQGDVAEQVATVREALRPVLMQARVGITGANALVARSGAAMIVTNEGNEGLVTTLADVHIVLAGADKLVRDVDDAVTQVRLLARSATGQRITTYTTLVRGPADAAQELHYVIVDNGRSAMRDDPEFRDALRCIRCAACASVCPPYQAVGGQVFGHIYSGAIGLVNTPFHHGLEAAAGPQSLCVSCNACQTVCPVDIPLPRQILAVRRRVVAEKGMPAAKRLVLFVWARPRLFRAVATAAAVLSRPLRRRDGTLTLRLPRRHAWRRLPAPALVPGRRLLPSAGTAREASAMRVAFLTQCITDVAAPEIAVAAAQVLRACGTQVVAPANLHCCGLPMLDAGDPEGARRLAKRLIETLESCAADWVVSTANSCVATVVHEYPELFAAEPRWRARAEALGSRTVDFATFVTEVAPLPDGAVDTTRPRQERLVYHPFCQTRTVLRADGAARRLLERCGLHTLPLSEADVCCGFGGSTSISAPEIGRAIVTRKLDQVADSGARTLVTDNPGCILHLRGAAAARGQRLSVLHLAEVVARSLRQAEPGPRA